MKKKKEAQCEKLLTRFHLSSHTKGFGPGLKSWSNLTKLYLSLWWSNGYINGESST